MNIAPKGKTAYETVTYNSKTKVMMSDTAILLVCLLFYVLRKGEISIPKEHGFTYHQITSLFLRTDSFKKLLACNQSPLVNVDYRCLSQIQSGRSPTINGHSVTPKSAGSFSYHFLIDLHARQYIIHMFNKWETNFK